jgi:hypothetical protein
VVEALRRVDPPRAMSDVVDHFEMVRLTRVGYHNHPPRAALQKAVAHGGEVGRVVAVPPVGFNSHQRHFHLGHKNHAGAVALLQQALTT